MKIKIETYKTKNGYIVESQNIPELTVYTKTENEREAKENYIDQAKKYFSRNNK